MGRGVPGANACGTGFRDGGPRGRAWEETGARPGPERPQLLLSAPSSILPAFRPLPPPDARPRLRRRLDSRVAGAFRQRRPRPARARRAERGRSERRRGGERGLRGGEAVRSRGGSPCAGATLGILTEREAVGLCVRVETTWCLWADWGRVVAHLAPLQPPGIAGWRLPGKGNLAFGGMNEELWKRLPTPLPNGFAGVRACV